MSKRPSPLNRRQAAARQRGAVLLVAMVVLVSLALASLAMLRSVDVAALVSGNLAFKRSALNSTDLGVGRAFAYFTSSVTVPSATLATGCYSAIEVDVNAKGIPAVLASTSAVTAFDTATSNACKGTGVDSGEIVRFYIDRQCAGLGLSVKESCTSAHAESTYETGSAKQFSNVDPVYRVTVRVDGPRNTTSFSQIIFQQGP